MKVKGGEFKMAIVLDENLALSDGCNAIALLSITIGKRIPKLVGKDFKDKSGTFHKGLSQFPIQVLKTNYQNLRKTYNEAAKQEKKVLFLDVTDATQTSKNYVDYMTKISNKENQELRIHGIALAGPSNLINKLILNFQPV